MKIVCGWCHVPIGEKAPIEDKRTSHGICEECKKKLWAEVEAMKK
jgi:hypothetical protein